MIVRIEPAVFGTDFPVYLDTVTGKMGRESPATPSHTLGPDLTGTLGELLRVEGRSVDLSPPEKYGRMMASLQVTRPPWYLLMPREEWKRWVGRITRSIRETIPLLEQGYYDGPFRNGSRVLERLARARVDRDAWQACMTGTAHGAVASFEPDDDGLAPEIRYNRWGTRTGRLGIETGPQILTLKKTARGMMRSRFAGGALYIFDYVSFEAQLALIFAGHQPRQDVYDDITNRLFGGEVPRNDTKIATMAMLFGGSDALIGRKLGLTNGDLQRAIADLKGYFGIRELEDRLLGELDEDSYIRNHWGRRIPVPEGERRLIVNTFIQSSAVDAALQGFCHLLDVLGDDGVPLFVIHDALMVDLKPAGIARISQLQAQCESQTGLPYTLPCRVERVEPLYTCTEVQ